MPQYLSPGVYVEEIDTGSKPIEGVSTSIGGMLGMTERGPVNIPIQLGSISDFNYWFGGSLDPETFTNQTCFLPHAVQGFFDNGGQELYVVRILEQEVAAFASTQLFGVAAATPAPTQLIAGTGTSPATTLIYVLDDANLTTSGTWVQIGNGSASDFLQVQGLTATPPNPNHVALRLPLVYGYSSSSGTVTMDIITLNDSGTSSLKSDVALGSTSFLVDSEPAVNVSVLLRLGTIGQDEEFVIAAGEPVQVSTNPEVWKVTVVTPTQVFHPIGGPATVLGSLPAPPMKSNLAPPGGSAGDPATVPPGSTIIFVDPSTNFTAGSLVRVTDGTHTEVRKVGTLSTVPLSAPAYAAYGPGIAVQGVTLTDDTGADDRNLTADATAGSIALALDDRSGLSVGSVLRIGLVADPSHEYMQIAALPNMPASGSAPGQIVLKAPLASAHAISTPAHLQAMPVALTGPVMTLALPAPKGALQLVVTDPTGLVAGSVLQLTGNNEDFYYQTAAGGIGTPTPRSLNLSGPLINPHVLGDPVTIRLPLLEVHALDQGAWGNRLRVAVEQGPPLVQSAIASFQDSTHIRLLTTNGVEPGTVLAVTDPSGTVTNLKVIAVDRQNNFLITLDPATPLPFAVTVGNSVTSLEFQIDVFLLRQPDPAVPSRNNTVIDFEVFPQLSMDPRHSRYVDKVIGTTWVPQVNPPVDDDGTPLRKDDMRSEGGSWYIRVHDEEPTAANKLLIRPGPVPLVDTLASGGTQPARMPLAGGDDGIGAVTASTYIGTDNVEPELRTGMYCFRNQEDISILACPGRTDAPVQGALITLAENLQYRFAVLDGPEPPDDQITDVQLQRQQFDTKYAAIYHPWLVIPDPFPSNLAAIPNYPIPPSGHVMGIYARVDTERGVHKAPANEVVSGIISLQRKLNKSEQDVLNPYPVNINVIRDFRTDNRGLRVYGARVITSDPDWKYVNVRRLMNFIEQSLYQGLQWVVFEPNDATLWARVKRSVSLFLTQTWRSGALQGAKPEQGFFVNCGLDTMTQTDLQNGRLIVVIGVACVYPAEFLILRIGLWAGGANS